MFVFLLYFSLLVLAQAAHFTNHFIGIRVGEPFVLSWEGDGTPVTITLLRGPDNNLVPIRNITADNPGNGTLADTFVWYPRPWLSSTISGHAMSITQSGVTETTGRFRIDTIIAHKPPTLAPIILDPFHGTLGGGWTALSAGASSAGYTGSWHPAYMITSTAPWPNITRSSLMASMTRSSLVASATRSSSMASMTRSPLTASATVTSLMASATATRSPTPIITRASSTASSNSSLKTRATESSNNIACTQQQARAVHVSAEETASAVRASETVVEKRAENSETRFASGSRSGWALIAGMMLRNVLFGSGP